MARLRVQAESPIRAKKALQNQMTAADDASRRLLPRRLQIRSYRALFMAVAAILAICILVLTGSLALGKGLLAVALICFAGWVGGVIAKRIPKPGSPVENSATRATVDGLQDLISALPDPTIVLAPDGRVVSFNAQASTMAVALRRGDPVSIALRAPEVIEAIRRCVASNKAERVEFAERVPAGRWSEAFVTPVHDSASLSGSRPALLLLIFHDLTPIRRVEEMRADFVANASHELRTPLAALSGFIETLKGPARNDTAARERFLDIMEAQANRMARLIDDLLSLSRIELAAHVRPVTPVELVPVVRQVVDALQTLARDRGVEVKIDAPTEPLVVPGDRDELIRAFENLIENALKYGGAGKRVDITLARAKAQDGSDEAVASVRDYGPGIPAEHIPRLTERFYRVDVTGSRALGGTGLGLALVKHVINRHRGRLVIESRIGQGATFTIRLPMSTEAGPT
jgi:two-component system phosphate regulon sensor histidine kinase PhoR